MKALVLSLSLGLAIAHPLTERACIGPDVNEATISLIKEFEGFVDSPAPDPIGLPTVGYGHLCQTSGCSEVPYSFPLTETTASELLASDLKVFLFFLVHSKENPLKRATRR
jgi:lysozyme